MVAAEREIARRRRRSVLKRKGGGRDEEEVGRRESPSHRLSATMDYRSRNGEGQVGNNLTTQPRHCPGRRANGPTDDEDSWTGDETHGISPHHLFAKEATNAPEKLIEMFNLTGENLPFKKKSKNTSSSLKSTTRYSTSAFCPSQTVHEYTHAKMLIEAAITLIAAIKLLMTNGKYLDPNMAFTPLKHDITITSPKLILREDDVSVNFTHLGQYVFTSGNRIFEKKKKNLKEEQNKMVPQ